MKWYEQNFVNRRDWVLDHLELLGLDTRETVIVLLIDFLNEHRQPLSIELLAKKSGLSEDEINETLSVLSAKKYLKINASASKIIFSLNGLYETNIAREASILDSSLFETFEAEFGRPLTNKEMEKISEWNRSTDKMLIIYALREASAYQKLSFPYIDTILRDWKNKGITRESIENK